MKRNKRQHICSFYGTTKTEVLKTAIYTTKTHKGTEIQVTCQKEEKGSFCFGCDRKKSSIEYVVVFASIRFPFLTLDEANAKFQQLLED